VDWLAPAPAGDFLRRRGCTVVPESERLLGSGGLYDRIFAKRTDDFNLMEYVESDTRLHRHDFRVSTGAWRDTEYDAIVGDEAFWLLSGFASRWSPKPAPFVFHRSPDVFLYIGSAGEIPDEPLGVLLPSRRG
jgi:hypothetical protein